MKQLGPAVKLLNDKLKRFTAKLSGSTSTKGVTSTISKRKSQLLTTHSDDPAVVVIGNLSAQTHDEAGAALMSVRDVFQWQNHQRGWSAGALKSGRRCRNRCCRCGLRRPLLGWNLLWQRCARDSESDVALERVELEVIEWPPVPPLCIVFGENLAGVGLLWPQRARQFSLTAEVIGREP